MSPGRQVVILSGGLDSTTCMALAARDADAPPLALSFDYGQSHRIELEHAAKVASHYGAERLVVDIGARAWGGRDCRSERVGRRPAARPERRGLGGPTRRDVSRLWIHPPRSGRRPGPDCGAG